MNYDANIANTMRSSTYNNDRTSQKAKLLNKSRLKIGRQSIQNRIGLLFAHISIDWICPLADKNLRVLLKIEILTQSRRIAVVHR